MRDIPPNILFIHKYYFCPENYIILIMDLKKAIGIGGAGVLLVIIALVVGFVLFARFTKVGGNFARKIPLIGALIAGSSGETFMTLRDPSFKETYNNTVVTLVDDGMKMMGRYSPVSPGQEDAIRASIMKKAMDFYKDGPAGKKEMINKLGSEMAKWLKEEASVLGEMHPELIDYYDNVIVTKALNYLTYLDTRFSYLDTMGISKKSGPVNVGEPLQASFHKGKVKPIDIYRENVLNTEVNRDHSGSAAQRKLVGHNVHSLISDIKRHGFSPGIKRRTNIDPRGIPRAMMRRLAQRVSSKDPNSMVRSGAWSVHDVMVAGRGFSNETMYKDAYDKFATRVGRPEHNTFKYISGRIVDPAESVERKINENILEGIKQDVKYGVV